jgi:catalase
MARPKSTPSQPEQSSTTGAGGERQTTNQGAVIADNQNSMKAAPRGPTLLEDFILREKVTRFDHERIPERIVHARGSSTPGFFELTQSLSQYNQG